MANGKFKVTYENFYSRDIKNPNYYKLDIHRLDYQTWLKDRWTHGVENPSHSETTFLWDKLDGYQNHQWCSDGINPFDTVFQRLSSYENTVVPACTGVGKTHIGALGIVYFLDVHMIHGCKVVCVGPSAMQLRKNLFSEFQHHFQRLKILNPWIEWKKNMEMQFVHPETGAITEILGAGVPSTDELSSSNLSGHHNEFMLFFFDETQGVAKAAINSALQTCSAPANCILAVGNPNNMGDSLHRLTKLRSFKTVRICAKDFPNVVMSNAGTLKTNELGVEVPHIQGAVRREFVDDAIADYGETSDFVTTRIYGMFPEKSGSSILSHKDIDACYRQQNFKTANGKPNTVAVDIAVSENGDDACAAYLQGGTLKHLINFSSGNSSAIAHNLAFRGEKLKEMLAEDNYENYNYHILNVGLNSSADFILEEECMLGIDCTANPSTAEALTRLGIECTMLYPGEKAIEELIETSEGGGVLFPYANIRTQSLFILKRLFETRQINIDIPEEQFELLKEELVAFRLNTNNAKKIALESKRDTIKRLGRSPNLADAFKYAVIMQAAYYEGLYPFRISGGGFSYGVDF